MPELAIPQPRGAAASQATTVEQSRAVAEVQAAIFVAQQFPRDLSRVDGEMRDACGRTELAKRAFYNVQNRGTGPSVHLAKELARIWGNIDYGVRELARDDDAGESEVLAFAWDQQTNSRQSRTFIVPHMRMARGERKPLTDLQDIYLMNQNIGARALRECIMTLLPTWYTETAQDVCRKTLVDGDGVPLPDRIAQAVAAFAGGGVKLGQLEARLGKRRGQWDAGDVASLQVLYTSIDRGETTVADEFPDAAPSIGSIVNGSNVAEPATVRPPDPAPAADPMTGEVFPSDEDAALIDPITDAQRDKMFAAFAHAGVTMGDRNTAANKASRLAYIRNAIGVDVGSTNDLTKRQASVVIEMLEKDIADGPIGGQS